MVRTKTWQGRLLTGTVLFVLFPRVTVPYKRSHTTGVFSHASRSDCAGGSLVPERFGLRTECRRTRQQEHSGQGRNREDQGDQVDTHKGQTEWRWGIYGRDNARK